MARDYWSILTGVAEKSIASNNLSIIISIYSNVNRGDDPEIDFRRLISGH
jgi:hypothetical protein